MARTTSRGSQAKIRTLATWLTPSPTYAQGAAVYGAGVAKEDFAWALANDAGLSRLEILTDAAAAGAVRAAATQRRRVGGAARVEVYPVDAEFSRRPRLPVDVFHELSSEVERGFWLRRAFSPRNFPITLTHHTISYEKMRTDWYLRLLLQDVQPYDALVCAGHTTRAAIQRRFEEVSEWLEERTGKRLHFGGRFEVLPLGVDTELFRPRPRADLRHQVGLPTEPFIISWIGRLSASQKADLLPLLRVFRNLVRANPRRPLLLVLAGTPVGGEDAVLADYAGRLGISEAVRIITDVAPARRHLLHGAADVFVSPADNIQETFGITPIEAMASGVPQVVSDWDGYRDTVVHGETGFLVPTTWVDAESDLRRTSRLHNNEDLDHLAAAQSTSAGFHELQRALQQLLDDPALRARMSAQSRRHAVKTFGWSALLRRYQALWSELSAEAKATRSKPRPLSPNEAGAFGTFQVYASSVLDDRSVLRLHADAAGVIDGEEPVPDYRSGIGQDPALTQRLLQLLLRRGPKGLALGALVKAAEDPQHGTDLVRRHAMGLLKLGYAEVVPEALSPRGARGA